MTEGQRIARVLELRAQGVSLRGIAEELGVSKGTVQNLVARYGPTCERCGITMRVPDSDGRCGFCKVEAVEALASPRPGSTFAVFELRDQGHPAEQVVAAVRRAKRGAPVAEVAAGLGVGA